MSKDQTPFIETAKAIEAAMQASGITRPQVAGTLDVSSQMVGRYLRGESMPARERMILLAQRLNTTEEALLCGCEYPRAGRRTHAAVMHIQGSTFAKELVAGLTVLQAQELRGYLNKVLK